MDVGVDTHDFRPWHFDEIRDRMKERAASTPGLKENIGRRHNQSDWGMWFFAQKASHGMSLGLNAIGREIPKISTVGQLANPSDLKFVSDAKATT